MALFEPARHEPLTELEWDEARASRACEAIVSRTLETFARQGSWPSHPNDLGPLAPATTQSLYFGTAGIVWALAQIGIHLPNDRALLRAAADQCETGMASRGEEYRRGLLLGPTGPLVVASLLALERDDADVLYELVRGNTSNPVRDFMWGSPGTMLAASAVFDATGDPRWKRVFIESARRLESELETSKSGARLWTQNLYGYAAMHVGAGHGFVGNLAPILARAELLSREDSARWRELARETTKRTALVADGLANWPQSIDGGRPGRDASLVQWCHGAPGVIAALGGLIDGTDTDFDAVLLAGGELVWSAGPLTKGGGLCHGTAGNGYALLRLFHQTKDEKWLERARRFAMHAIGQYEHCAAEHGDLRYSLWTGDLGTALYLRACITPDPRFPSFQYL